MVVTWSSLGKAGEPISGKIINFENLEESFAHAARNVRDIERDLEDIRLGRDEAQFKGQAADAFSGAIGEIDNWVDDLAEITEEIGRIFGRHASKLEELNKEVDQALARAQTAWNRRDSAASSRRDAQGSLDWIDHQLRQLMDEDGGARRADLEWQRDDAASELTSAQRAETLAISELDSAASEWDAFEQRAEDLEIQTADELRAVNLEDLANPNWISQRWSNIKDLATWAADGVKTHLADVLESIYRAIDTVLVGLAAMALLLAVTGIGAPIAAFLGTVAGVLAITKALIGAILYATTDRISTLDIVGDLIAMVTLGASRLALHAVKHAGKASKLFISEIEGYLEVLKLIDDLDNLVTVVSEFGSEVIRPLSYFTPLGPIYGWRGADIDIDVCWSLRAPQLEMGTRTLMPTGW